MDVVWLKRDCRLHDHGPFADVTSPRNNSPVCIIYLYEPDQLSEHSVHGSHIHFINEGLLELDAKISGINDADSNTKEQNKNNNNKVNDDDDNDSKRTLLRSITTGYCTITHALQHIHSLHPIKRLLSHMETGHMTSYKRDQLVRRWCRSHDVTFIEYDQTGITRGPPHRHNRNDFSSRLATFMTHPLHDTVTPQGLTTLRRRLITTVLLPGIPPSPPGSILPPSHLTQIPPPHTPDRPDRQRGGESLALTALRTFLTTRGVGYSKGISSPRTSWHSGGRLSPYLAWGQLSVRFVVHRTERRKCEINELLSSKRRGGRVVAVDGRWGRSLADFLSRLHWRSHFMQKLETEPQLERENLCRAYDGLRRQANDWNESYYIAWCNGRTGFPFVDACMRCLARHGWINFRMRAMLVSFACYNLWLDWRGIAGHLARSFLDYEPGIHYPQLQMQAGVTGINAMRVYNVVKQGKDQDPEGVFVKTYVPELCRVPKEHVHEPWMLSKMKQNEYGVILGVDYPQRIVNEITTAKAAKDKVAAVRNQEGTKRLAREVYIKHGSRKRSSDFVKASTTGLSQPVGKKARSMVVDTVVALGQQQQQQQQPTLKIMFEKVAQRSVSPPLPHQKNPIVVDDDDEESTPTMPKQPEVTIVAMAPSQPQDKKQQQQQILRRRQQQKPSPTSIFGKDAVMTKQKSTITTDAQRQHVTIDDDDNNHRPPSSWSCRACTFVNEKPLAPVCEICGTAR